MHIYNFTNILYETNTILHTRISYIIDKEVSESLLQS